MDILFVVILGALWGSFANVCIYRLPLNKNIVKGRSFCPNCNSKILWFDNIPIISFIFLKAKCRNCEFRIPFRYPVVELLNLFIFLLVYLLFGITLTTLLLWILFLSFIIIFFYRY